ncbi:MAG: hypothetical protein RL095_2078 [Verrucomicrobiota bacterium]|jgi:uncharacterized protein (DUF1501 family)
MFTLNRRSLIAGALGSQLLSCASSHLGNGAAIRLDHPAKAKRLIYLSMVGGPSQIDLLDPKPGLGRLFNTDLPESTRKGQRLTGMTAGQARFPIAPSKFQFSRSGKSGLELSELVPHWSRMADEMCIIRTMYTEAINHEPAMQYMYTGNMNAGLPSIGAWLSHGLGTMNPDLPTFAVLSAQHTLTAPMNVQAVPSRLWGSGFLAGENAGVSFRSGANPVLYLNNPPGIDPALRRRMLDGIGEINARTLKEFADVETRVRSSQYEMAYRMQSSVPELVDLSKEPEHILDLYGPDVKKPGSFAASALLARRLVERGTRVVQIFHNGWDQHRNLPVELKSQCQDVDQACYALVADLKQRGLLDDTIVLWGGEFGRTVYCQGALSQSDYGRDHHPRCFSMWAAGGGFKPGSCYGKTDDFSYNIDENGVHIRDLHATILHLFGIDHSRFTVKNQGLDTRLTGVEEAHVVKGVLA